MSGANREYISRRRSLADFNAKFGEGIVEHTLNKAMASRGAVRLLEIGCGEGRVLMELRKLFPSVEMHGINKKPWPAMRGRESLIATATNHKIFTREEAERVSLPILHFYDAAHLDFPDGYFDVVISQVSIYQIKRKDLLLEEAWRVLKKGASAFLHMDSTCDGYPDFLNQETPRFLIYQNGTLYPFEAFVGRLRAREYNIACRIAYGQQRDDACIRRTAVIMQKNTDEALHLGLTFDELSSFDVSALGKMFNGDKIVGFRSVYRLENA